MIGVAGGCEARRHTSLAVVGELDPLVRLGVALGD